MSFLKRMALGLWYVLTLQCDEAERLRSITDPVEMRWHERLAERLHRIGCSHCRKAKRQMDCLQALIRRLGADQDHNREETLSPQARVRIHEALRKSRRE